MEMRGIILPFSVQKPPDKFKVSFHVSNEKEVHGLEDKHFLC